jgi:hypothetical protein
MKPEKLTSNVLERTSEVRPVHPGARGRFLDPREEEVEVYCPVARNPIHSHHDRFLGFLGFLSLRSVLLVRDVRAAACMKDPPCLRVLE